MMHKSPSEDAADTVNTGAPSDEAAHSQSVVEEDNATTGSASTSSVTPNVEMTAHSASSDNELQQAANRAQQRCTELEDQLLRVRAEMQNQQRRSLQNIEKAHQYGQEKLLGALLPVIDALEQAITSLQEAVGQNAVAASSCEGIELTYKLLLQTLEKNGVSVINPVGEIFDPNLHEAMTMQPSDEQVPNTVLQVVQKGYRLHDRLLRAAMVIVAQALPQAAK